VCPVCSAKEKYNWKPFYRGRLQNYERVSTYGDVHVYSNQILETPTGKPADSIESWILANAKPGSSIEILDNAFPRSKLVNPNIDFKEGSKTVIEKQLRGSHQFYVYLKDSLQLNILKQDLNALPDDDSVVVSLTDLDNNLVFQNSIDDDKAIGKEGQPISKDIAWDNLPYTGVYKLAFKGSNDWLIKKLEINSNKVVFTGSTLVLDPTTFYTELQYARDFKVYAWRNTAQQIVTFNGLNPANSKNLDINLSKLSFEQTVSLVPDAYTIQVKGDQYLSGHTMALNKDSYFNPFSYNFDVKAEDNPQFVLSNLKVEDNNGLSKVKVSIPKTNFFRLSNLKEVRFELRNAKLDQTYRLNKDLVDQGYKDLGQYGYYKVWSKSGFTISDREGDDMVQFIKANVPDDVTLDIDNKSVVNQGNFYSEKEPAGFQKTNDLINAINYQLRGSHSFYVYLDGSLNLEVNKQDLNAYLGTDEVQMSLVNFKGNKLCETTIEDDRNTDKNNVKGEVLGKLQCTGLDKGVYLLQINELNIENNVEKNDYILKTIKINTNKIIVKDRVLSIDPANIYTANRVNKDISLYYWLPDKDQIVDIKNSVKNKVELTKEDIAKTTSTTLDRGKQTISFSKGYIRMTGSNFAFKPEQWFDIWSIDLSTNKNVKADVKLVKYPLIESSYIKSLKIDVE
jgi:hypothetical protein